MSSARRTRSRWCVIFIVLAWSGVELAAAQSDGDAAVQAPAEPASATPATVTTTQSQAPAPAATTPAPAQPATRSIGLTVSGAISLGAYEAGFNWALIRYLRLQDDPGTRLREAVPMRLVLSTGASAGNINTLLSAMDWCEEIPPSASKSRFGLWRDLGLQHLVPDDSKLYNDGDGLLSRRKLDEVFEQVGRRLGADVFREACKRRPVVLGVTMTSNQPEELDFGGIRVSSSRASVLWDARTAADGSLELQQIYSRRQPADENESKEQCSLYRGAIGEQVYLGTDEHNRLSHRGIMEVLKASSAVQAAFGPVRIQTCVQAPGTARAGDERCSVVERRTATGTGQHRALQERRFSDGGLFDNTPVGLALALAYDAGRTASNAGVPGAPAAPGVDEIIYIDPDARRGQDRVEQREERDGVALGSVLRLFAGLLESGRGYELATVRRYWGDHADRIVASSRYHGAVGEHLAHFGAFLGKPFRDYDYYVGIYDGLQFVVDRICAPPPAADAAPRVWAARPPGPSCRSDVFEHLLLGFGLAHSDAELEELTRELLDFAAGGEREEVLAVRERLEGEAKLRFLLRQEQLQRKLDTFAKNDERLAAVLAHISDVLELDCDLDAELPTCQLPFFARVYRGVALAENPPPSQSSDFLVGALESDGIAYVLRSLRGTFDDDAGHQSCKAHYDEDECTYLKRWAETPELEGRYFLHRLIARQQANEPPDGQAAILGLARGILRQEQLLSVGNARPDGSSAGPEWGWTLLPYHLSSEPGRSGFLLGWRVEPFRSFATFNVEPTPLWARVPVDADDTHFSALAAGLTLRPRWLALGKIDFNLIYRKDWSTGEWGLPNLAPQLTLSALLDKLRLSAMYFPDNDDELVVTVGLSDIAGVIDVVSGD